MRRLRILLLLLLTSSCTCSEDTIGGLPDDAGSDGTDGGPGSQCVAEGAACDRATTTCCSGVCGDNQLCTAPFFCKAPAEACSDGSECCTLSCANGACSGTLCNATGQVCTAAADCCSTLCGAGGTCEVVPPGPGGDTCHTLGEGCAAGGECCSTNCQGGVCVRAYSCQANGDICQSDDECCGHACSAANGQAGRCQMVTGGGGGGCIQGGNPCSGGSNCCSRICLDLGTGVTVCQVAGGCTLTGEFCTDDDACCGGGVNPNGSVVCDPGTSRCDNGQSCNGVGNICGAPVLPSGGSINASQNCCDGKKEVCKLDSSGIPRCFGGCPNDNCSMDCPTGYDPDDANCCIQAGDACQFRDQCCNRLPCVPGPSGGFVCADTPACLPLGSVCTPGSDPMCCGGTNCAPAAGGGNACQLGQPDPGSGSDGGVVGNDGGTGPVDAGPPCAAMGGTCSTGAECCSGVCTNGSCGTPTLCRPQGTSCTANGDCCTGLSCTIPQGGGSGTCENNGMTCGNIGQPCSANAPCCNALSCDAVGTITACDGTTACVCAIHL